MIKPIVPFVLSLAVGLAASATAQEAPSSSSSQLTLEQTTALRCSAAFAIVAERQANNDDTALSYPPMAERGREFFVRSSARVMDETGLTRDEIAALLYAEAQGMEEGDAVDRIMPSCLLLLEASGV